jgi:hypothetical protein
MAKYSVIEHRNKNDFKYGSFDVIVRSNEVILVGILKRGNRSRFMTIRRKE